MRKIKKGFFILLTVSISSIFFAVFSHAENDSAPSFHNATKSSAGDLSFYFQNIELKALLQLIAKNSGFNFIISDAVKGSITLNLQHVTWNQALDVVLKSHGLASRRIGNIMYISTVEEITNNEAKQLQSEAAMSNIEPLKSTIIHLKYANAADVSNLLKSSQSTLLTQRGEVAVDSRTNSLIVRDVKTTLSDVERTIHVLDVPARQVLIEARIVNIDSTYEEQIGVRFGVSTSRHLSGTFAGANNINSGISPAALADPTQRLNFNVPAHQIFDGTNPGSIAIALAHLGPALLDLELSALEGEQHAKIVARPRVITSNLQKAVIQTGQEIPYQQATSSGATSVTFKDAVLSLEITPQITPDNKIILSLKANEDTQGQSITTGASATTGSTVIPIINTEAVQSNVILNDKETIVLGGIYRQTKQNGVDRIPFLGTLPIVGMLFRHNSTRDEKHELLIFITPHIIKSLSSVPPKNNNIKRIYKL